MSAPALTLAAVRKFNPCEVDYRRVSEILPKRGKIAAQQAVDAGCTLNDIAWVATKFAKSDKAVARRLRHWSADCAARMLPIYERDYPTDMRLREAIVASRQFADGEIDDAARAAACRAAWDAAWRAPRDAVIAAVSAAVSPGACIAASASEEAWQLDRLVRWLGDDEPAPLELPPVQGETQ